MLNPEVYAKINVFQRKECKKALEEFEDKLNWKALEGDTLIDIGCGPGDVTYDYVLPALSEKFKKIVASDIAPDMLEYAKEKYGKKEPRMEFQVMDIGVEISEIGEQYDHMTSFFTLNFVENQSQCFKNIYDMLKPGGDGVIVILVDYKFFELYEALMNDPKWSSHVIDFKRYIPPFYYMEDPLQKFKEFAKEAGFKNIVCSLKKDVHTINLETFKVFRKVKNSLKPSSEHLSDEFDKDYLTIAKRINLVHETKDEVNITYSVIVAYIKK